MSKNKKRKLNKKRVFKVLFILIVIFVFFYKLFNTNITNIYISGNDYLKDQEIIDISKLDKYPLSIRNTSGKIEKRLENKTLILSAKVKKNILLNEVYIEVKENYPLFYYEKDGKTILYDETKYNDKLSSPILINYVKEEILDEFIKHMKKLDREVLNRISEIEYIKEGKSEKFLLYMNDGNYVYVNFKNFKNLNKYIEIVKSFDGQKGVLNLDSGNNFEVFNEKA